MSSHVAPPGEGQTRESDKVSLTEKIALGVGSLPIFYGYAAVGSIAVPYFQMTLQVDPVLLGTAIALPRLWDAFTDPAMAFISDNTRSRFGRRRPYIVTGALLMAASFGAIWMAPTHWSGRAISTYVTIALFVFYTCYTVFSVPWTALQYEMTPDPHERTRVASFSGFFGKIGEISYSWFFVIASSALFASAVHGVRTVGWLVAIVFFGVVGCLPGLFVRERYLARAATQPKIRILPSLKASFTNRAFIILVGLTILQIVAGMFTSNIDSYLITYSLSDGVIAEGQYWKAVLSTGYAVVGILTILPLNWFSKRYGKQMALMAAFALSLLGSVGKWVLFLPGDWAVFEALDRLLESIGIHTPGSNWKILLDPLLCAPVWIAINVLTVSMLADVCDEDELKYGVRREGVFGGLLEWIKKTGYSLGFLGAFVMVKLTGFDAALGGNQPPGTLNELRAVLVVTTAAWAIAAMIVLRYYPIDHRRAYRTRDDLEARRGTIT